MTQKNISQGKYVSKKLRKKIIDKNMPQKISRKIKMPDKKYVPKNIV